MRRPRFLFSLSLAIIFLIFSFINKEMTIFSPLEKVLFSYNIFQWFYIMTLFYLIFTAKAEDIKKVAKKEDESVSFVLVTAIASSLITLVAIAFELSTAKESHGILKTTHLALPGITLVGVWLFLPTLFAIHYAHNFYYDNQLEHRIVKFPDGIIDPDYWDFLYFSVTIAVASQTADVSVNSRTGRKLVLTQSVLAFLFNTSVLALGINVSASLLN